MVCGSCGATAPEDARFCPACGHELAPAAAREERKLVSILFVDQVGSTARAEVSDPEDIRDLNRLYYEEARAHIERHGGVLEKYIGDAVMAVFGAPLSRSDDAERAVRAALAIIDGIAELNEQHDGTNLQVRAGVCTGEALVDIDAGPQSALATGDVVNTAARLQSAAPTGRVIVGEETYRLTKNAFHFEALDSIAAKGKKDPVTAWLVIAPTDATAIRPSERTPLIGRERELRLIEAIWDSSVEARQTHLLTIVGPAGIGKSRIAREIAARAETAEGRVLWGRCLPYDQQTPYHAAGQMIRRLASIFENDTVEAARSKLSAYAASLFEPEEASTATRYLSLLLGIGLDERAQETIDLQFALRRLLERLSESHPLLVVFDDVHWADEASLDLLTYLTTHLTDHRVMMIALARPEFVEARQTWGAGLLAHTSLILSPLRPEDANEIVRALIDSQRSETIDKIVSTAEGNPLFIEELVAAIREDTKPNELPATVRAAIAARIDALPADARAALLGASVIGKAFWRGVLDRIVDVKGIDAALDALETRGLIQRRTPSTLEGEAEYAFKHDLTLETAYATLSRAARKQMHAATADALEATVTDPREIAWILARHRQESGEAPAARRYLMMAADRARDALAVEETFDLFEQALALADNQADRVRIKYLRGLALAQLEDFARAGKELDEVIPYLAGRDKVEALIARSRSALWTEDLESTLANAQEARSIAQQEGFADLEAIALGRLSSAEGMRGDLTRALDLGRQALEIWKPEMHEAEIAEFHHLLADAYYWAGDYSNAMESANNASQAAGEEVHSREWRLRGAGMRGLILSGQGHYEEAIAAGTAAIELARAMGRPTNVVMNYSTLPLREIFALDEAVQRSDEVAENLGPSDFNMPWMNARADAFGARVLAGEFGKAQREWPPLWEHAVQSGGWERWLVSGRVAAVYAEMAVETGDNETALEWGQRALDMAVESDRKKYEIVARTALGRALVAERNGADALKHLRAAVALSDQLGSPLFRWQARAALADGLELVGGNGDPGETRSEASSIIGDIVAGLTPEHAKGYRAMPIVQRVLEKA